MRARRAAHARGTQGASRYDRGVMRTRERIDGAGLAARIAAAAMVSRRSRDDPPLVEQIEEVIVPWPRRRVERRRARRRRLRRRRSKEDDLDLARPMGIGRLHTSASPRFLARRTSWSRARELSPPWAEGSRFGCTHPLR